LKKRALPLQLDLPLRAIPGLFFLPLLLLFSACAPMEPSQTNLASQTSLPAGNEEQAAPALIQAEEEITPAEPERDVTKELTQLENVGSWEEGTPQPPPAPTVTYDFPVTINRHVQFYLDFFQNEQREDFARWLARSGRYLPMIQEELRKAGLPLDLAYLPMIESGFSLTAYSRARAMGPWQFMRATGKHYGLVINSYVDERRDPIKSTQAAIRYLSDLYDEFQSWHLAVAAYNAGEGKIRRAIKRYKTDNFWEIAKHRFLRLETKRYVPKLIAAILIAKEPEKYGFGDVVLEAPLQFETVHVPRWTSLKAIALAGGLDYEELRDLNRQLRRAITPPTQPSYPIRVPTGTATKVAQNLSRVQVVVETRFRDHVVRPGDTLTRICRNYNLNKTTLLKANNLRTEQLVIGQHLRIPYQTTTYRLLKPGETPPRKIVTAGNTDMVLHTMRRGETVWELSRRYGVEVDMIAAWNDLSDFRKVRAGQQLAIYLPKNSKKRAGDHQQHAARSASESRYYLVKNGDTLWSIAKKFDLTPELIRKWNNLSGDIIYPGNQLLLNMAADIDS